MAARMDSQHTYSPLAAVYSSWTSAGPIQKDISQRPAHTAGERGSGEVRTATPPSGGGQSAAATYLEV